MHRMWHDELADREPASKLRCYWAEFRRLDSDPHNAAAFFSDSLDNLP